VNYVIRADAAPEIGTGHVMRCLRLAAVLRANGGKVRFVCRELTGSLRDRIEAEGCEVIMLPPSAIWPDEGADAKAVQAQLAGTGCDWLIVDHYTLGAGWERSMRAAARRIMVIDDLCRPHDCDVLLDQNFHAAPDNRYDGKLPAGAITLLGPRYALLADEFAPIVPPSLRDGQVRRILVSLGGVDQVDATSVVLDALDMAGRHGAAIDVVIGAAHPRRDQIVARCAAMADTICHIETREMAALITAADIAIGAGGTSTWERCALGLPTLALCVAENQRNLIAHASRAGLIYAVDGDNPSADKLARHIQALMENSGLRALISSAGTALVDGRGAARVAAALSGGAIAMRLATQADCDALHEWRNHPSVRLVSRNQKETSLEDHRRWFASVRASASRDLLVGESGGTPVGVVRFDRQGDCAEVSIYLVPGAVTAARGQGSALLLSAEEWLARSHPQVKTVKAEVLDGNQPSLGLFERCGYARDSYVFLKRLHR